MLYLDKLVKKVFVLQLYRLPKLSFNNVMENGTFQLSISNVCLNVSMPETGWKQKQWDNKILQIL